VSEAQDPGFPQMCPRHGWYDPCPVCRDENQILRELLDVNKQVLDTLDKILKALTSKTSGAVALTLEVSGGNPVPTSFTVDENGLATVQFVDDHNDPGPGPLDGGSTPSGNPIVPTVTSDDTSVFPSGMVMVGNSTPGNYTLQLVPLAAGVANIGLAALTNSDATPALDSVGLPFGLPPAVEVTVTPGPAVALTMTVTSDVPVPPTSASESTPSSAPSLTDSGLTTSSSPTTTPSTSVPTEPDSDEATPVV